MSFFTPSLASLYIFLTSIRAFSSILFSVHSTMIQPYFTPQFLRPIFSLFQSALSAVFCYLAILRGPVPERPISTNPGLKVCSFLVFYLPMYCLGKHYVSSLYLGVGPNSIL